MNDDSDVVRRINNQLATVAENQARFDAQMAAINENQARFDEKMAVTQEALADLIQVERIQNARTEENSRQIAALIEVARIHDEQIDRNSQQIKENTEAMRELREGLREQREHINALIRIVEGHITNHPEERRKVQVRSASRAIA